MLFEGGVVCLIVSQARAAQSSNLCRALGDWYILDEVLELVDLSFDGLEDWAREHLESVQSRIDPTGEFELTIRLKLDERLDFTGLSSSWVSSSELVVDSDEFSLSFF